VALAFEEMNEKIEVIGYFDSRTMRPLRFRWRGRAYHISQVNGVWSTPLGRDKEYHFHVTTKEAGSFEMIYNNNGFSWRLVRSCLDGR
jgi:hypothetical protein